ncbi:sigma-70 family RNA polymerase sigma factor [Nonomuraea sp. NPDC049129]|uniref:RNA polymerase sigma factor n=1 Tax=Nonomuraea sp. NPDC049129 TaxID=3155272 RepID=UPI0033DD571D
MILVSSEPVADMEPFVRAAQQGDPEGLARLLQHEYPGMRAVAVGVLGAGPDADDACQDAAVTALSRIGDLRDPSKVRPWLHAIVRNNCRMILRNRLPGLVESAGADLIASFLDDPVAAIERSALRDLVWHGLRQLTPATLPVAMLRYFTVRNSYAEIATLCGIPVGTVRSRLSDARGNWPQFFRWSAIIGTWIRARSTPARPPRSSPRSRTAYRFRRSTGAGPRTWSCIGSPV